MKTMNIVCEEEFMMNLKKCLQNSTTTDEPKRRKYIFKKKAKSPNGKRSANKFSNIETATKC